MRSTAPVVPRSPARTGRPDLPDAVHRDMLRHYEGELDPIHQADYQMVAICVHKAPRRLADCVLLLSVSWMTGNCRLSSMVRLRVVEVILLSSKGQNESSRLPLLFISAIYIVAVCHY